MYLTAETVTVDDDEGRFTLEIVDDEGDRHSFIIHHIDLDAFYDQVKGRIGPYLQERDEAKREEIGIDPREARRLIALGFAADRGMFPCDPDESGGYAADDPKH